jgi:hypothetical protein
MPPVEVRPMRGRSRRRLPVSRWAPWLAAALILVGCEPALPAIGDTSERLIAMETAQAAEPSRDPEIVAFVEDHDLSDLFHAVELLRLAKPEELVVFGVAYDRPRIGGLYVGVRGLRYRGRIGWLPPARDSLPRYARRHRFEIEPQDTFLFSTAFADTVRAVDAPLWTGVLAPLLARHPATPRDLLLYLVETEAGLAGELFENPRVRQDLDLLRRLEPGRNVSSWRAAMFEQGLVAARDPTTPREVLHDLVHLLRGRPGQEALLEALVRHPTVERDVELLSVLVREMGSRASAGRWASVSAMSHAEQRLLRHPAVPDSVLRLIAWHLAIPGRTAPDDVMHARRVLEHPRVRANPELLHPLTRLDPWHHADVRTEAIRRLLTHPQTSQQVLLELAAEIARNTTSPNPYPYPTREHAALLLRQPRARSDTGLLEQFVFFLRGYPEIRAEARALLEPELRRLERPMTPEEVTEHVRHIQDAQRMLGLHAYVAAKLAGGHESLETARRTLAEWRTRRPPPPTLQAWAEILDTTPPDQLIDRLMERSERMDKLRALSPFVSLLTPEERAELFDGIPLP